MLWIPKFIMKFTSSFIIDFKNNPNQFELPVHAMKKQGSTLKSFDYSTTITSYNGYHTLSFNKITNLFTYFL